MSVKKDGYKSHVNTKSDVWKWRVKVTCESDVWKWRVKVKEGRDMYEFLPHDPIHMSLLYVSFQTHMSL